MTGTPNPAEIQAQLKAIQEKIKARQQQLNLNSHASPRPPPPSNPIMSQAPRPVYNAGYSGGNPVRPSGFRPSMPNVGYSSSEQLRLRIESQKFVAALHNKPAEVPVEQKIIGGLNIPLHPLLMGGLDKSDKDGIMNVRPNFATAKANQKQPAKPVVKEVVKPKVEEDVTKNPYFDPELGLDYAVPKPRMSRNLKFNDQGKWIEKGNQARREVMLEKLKEKIAERAKAAGMEEELDLVSDKVLKKEPPPEVEWWDRDFFAQPALGIERVFDYDKLIFTEEVGITNLIQHPVPIKPPSERKKVVPKPLMLTKEERKKLRRQRRAEALKEKQEKIRLGLLPPEQAKVKLSNLMRVLASEAVQDPTQIEAQVRQQVADRKRTHEKQNADRKLTDEERREKVRKKMSEDVKQHGIISLVFKVKSLESRQHKFKVDKNASQLQLSGIGIINKNFCLVIVEGGPKSIKAYKKLMLRRIQWDESRLEETEEADTSNYCHLIWEGEIPARQFKGFNFRPCPTEPIIRQTLAKNKAEHYWDLAKAVKIDSLTFEKDNL